MNYDEIFDDTVPQRAVVVTRTSRYLLPVAADATLDDIAGLPTDDLLVEHAPYVETVSVGEAAADDVLTFTASQMFPSRPLLDAASRLLPASDGDARGRIGDEADAILARRRGGGGLMSDLNDDIATADATFTHHTEAAGRAGEQLADLLAERVAATVRQTWPQATEVGVDSDCNLDVVCTPTATLADGWDGRFDDVADLVRDDLIRIGQTGHFADDNRVVRFRGGVVA